MLQHLTFQYGLNYFKLLWLILGKIWRLYEKYLLLIKRLRMRHPRFHEVMLYISACFTMTSIKLIAGDFIFLNRTGVVSEIPGLLVLFTALGELYLIAWCKTHAFLWSIRIIQFICFTIFIINTSINVHFVVNHPNATVDPVDLEFLGEDILSNIDHLKKFKVILLQGKFILTLNIALSPIVYSIGFRRILRLKYYSCGLYNNLFTENKLSTLLGYGEAFKKTTFITLLTYLTEYMVAEEEDIIRLIWRFGYYMTGSTHLLYGILTEKKNVWHTVLFFGCLTDDLYFFSKRQSELLLLPQGNPIPGYIVIVLFSSPRETFYAV
ncbi:hypothetical protein L596_009721 [Steinernema carpocapsae]|uniref:Uncharacterized protein n=1 Tax=Steinernema carpocapsae TaxID=34508 RepID=A0A4U5PG67_STECR|nr:hypothetical protein L596_009721 [Steinernema carpocapsae]